MRLRTVFFWCHLTAGLFAGVVIFIMSMTGVMLTYEKQMLAWSDRRAAAIEAPIEPVRRATPTELLVAAQAAYPPSPVISLTRRSGGADPDLALLGTGETMLLNPYTGALIGPASPRLRRVFRMATDWHRYLAGKGEYRALGKALTGAANLAFLFIVLSGLYLWFPRRWSIATLTAVTVPHFGHATGKARDFNWHNALGFWGAIPLAIVVASATVISYQWASDLAYRITGENPPTRSAPAPAARGPSAAMPAPVMGLDRLDALWARAEQQQSSWRAITLRLPASSGAPLVFTIDGGWAGEPHKRGTLTLAPTTGAMITWEPFSELSAGRRLRSFLRFAHTGEVAGLLGQTIAGIASAIGGLMVATGFALSWRRFIAWRRRRRTAPVLERAA